MPTYDYVCDACDHAFEEFQAMSAKQLKKCPVCGKARLRRLIGTGAGVIFKGSGFYETDYRSDSYKKSADADKPGEGKAEKGDKGDSSTATNTSGGDGKPAAASSSDSRPAKPEAKAEKPALRKNEGKGKAKD